jgi:cytoskeletal protein RodZ
LSSAVEADRSRRLERDAEQEALWNSLGGRWFNVGLLGSLAIAVLLAVLVILGGRPSGGDSSQQLPRAVSAQRALPVAVGEAQEKSRKANDSRKTTKPEKKSATPAAPVIEPSFEPPPTRKKRSSPAVSQPATEPVVSSPPPSSSGGGSNDPPPQAHSDPPPQAQHGIGAGETWHGFGPGGG